MKRKPMTLQKVEDVIGFEGSCVVRTKLTYSDKADTLVTISMKATEVDGITIYADNHYVDLLPRQLMDILDLLSTKTRWEGDKMLGTDENPKRTVADLARES